MRVLTMGTFDLLHPGHLHLLAWCREMAGADGEVVATVNRDEFVERYKGRRPVMDENSRQTMVDALAEVDRCLVHEHDEQASATIVEVDPHVLAIGADWRDRDYLGQLGVDQAWLDDRDVLLVYVPLLEGYSSTALREAMA